MPLGSPFGPFCASTPLPKLIAARSLPVGARSFSTSGGAAPCADADSVAASSMTAAEINIRMAILPVLSGGRRGLRPASRFARQGTRLAVRRKPVRPQSLSSGERLARDSAVKNF